MEKKTSILLEQAQSLVTTVTGTDITKTQRAEVMKQVRSIYRQINHKTTD